jgi:hypothetical protein
MLFKEFVPNILYIYHYILVMKDIVRDMESQRIIRMDIEDHILFHIQINMTHVLYLNKLMISLWCK